jgi:hypothetical protein
LSARSLAARLDGFCRFTFTARRGSCIAAFIPAMFRYPRTRALVTWPNSKSQRRNRLLIFRWGKHLSATLFCNRVKRSHHADVSAGPKRTSRSFGAEDDASAHHQARVRGRQFDRRHSWVFNPFAGLLPMRVARRLRLPGLHAVSPIVRRD